MLEGGTYDRNVLEECLELLFKRILERDELDNFDEGMSWRDVNEECVHRGKCWRGWAVGFCWRDVSKQWKKIVRKNCCKNKPEGCFREKS